MKHKISEVNVVPIKPQNGLIAIASIVFDGCLYLGSIGIYTSKNGEFRLTYPTRKNRLHSYNVFHPINQEISNQIKREVIKKFEEVMKNYAGYSGLGTQ